MVIREGEDGDCFYVIAAGEVAVTSNGTAVRTLQRGDGFGEIALLHALPRTATCMATTDGTLFILHRDDFLVQTHSDAVIAQMIREGFHHFGIGRACKW